MAAVLGNGESEVGSKAKTTTSLASVQASLGSLAATSTTAGTKKAQAKKNAGKKKGQEDDRDDKSSVGAVGGLQGVEASDFIVQLEASDPEMARVCRKHESIQGTTASCLAHLSIERFLAGCKWGQKLTGAGCCENFVDMFLFNGSRF